MALHERRASGREQLRLPLDWLDGMRAWTRDVSPGGMYVYVGGLFIPSPRCQLELTFTVKHLRCHAEASVLRIEPAAGGTGVALQLQALRLHFHPIQ